MLSRPFLSAVATPDAKLDCSLLKEEYAKSIGIVEFFGDLFC